MSSTTGAPLGNKAPETLSIKMQDIPTDLLERLLADFVQQINSVYRKKQGDIPIKDYEEDKNPATKDDKASKLKAKKTLKDLSRIDDTNELMEERTAYVNEELRKLGVPEEQLLTATIEQETTADQPIAGILSSSLVEIMTESIRTKFPEDEEVHIDKRAVSLMTRFATQHFINLTQRLQRLMEIQRRKLPNRDDVALLHREGIFDKSGIHDMYDLSKKWVTKPENQQKLKDINNKSNAALTSYNGTDMNSFNKINDVFIDSDEWWVDKIIPRKKHRYYIPEWMPPLPPDYTYKSTPKFNERVSNPVVLRERVVNEGRIGEKALDHIILRAKRDLDISDSEDSSSNDDKGDDNDDDTRKDNDKIDADTEIGAPAIASSDINNITDEKLDGKSDDIKQPENEAPDLLNDAKSANSVDLVELAKKRMQILEERRRKEEERIAMRVNSEESRFGKTFGLYTDLKKLPVGIKEELNDYRHKKLKTLVHDLEKQAQFNTKWFIEQEELRKKIAEEKSKYTEANEIELGTGVPGNEMNFDFPHGDEDVDFEVEFSDIEEFNDHKTVKETVDVNMSEEPVTIPAQETNAPTFTEQPEIVDIENVTNYSTIETEIPTGQLSKKRPYAATTSGHEDAGTVETSLVNPTIVIEESPEVETFAVKETEVEEMSEEEEDIDMEMFEDV